MGYKRPQRTISVTFDDSTEFGGWWFRANSVPVEKFLEMRRSDAYLLKSWAEQVTEWNLEDDDGNPIPVSKDAVMGLDATHVRSSAMAWYNAISRIIDPKAPPPPLEALADLA